MKEIYTEKSMLYTKHIDSCFKVPCHNGPHNNERSLHNLKHREQKHYISF